MPQTETKFCSSCSTVKPTDEFHKNSAQPDGFNHRCTPCRRAYDQTPVGRSIVQRGRIKLRYGISVEEYEEIIARPCAICSATENIQLDHCHISNQVRGALCANCNKALGLFKDKPELLTMAAQYLREHQ